MPEIGSVDPVVFVTVAGATIVVLLLLMATATIIVLQPRMRLRKRMAVYGLLGGETAVDSARAGHPRQKRIQDKLKELEEKKNAQLSRRNQLRADLLQAGIDVNVTKYLVFAAFLGLAATGIYVAFGLPLLGAVPVGLAVGFGLPKLALRFIAKRRQKKFTSEFASAIDVLVRGVKSGLPVGECLTIIGRESPEPVGEEFRLFVEGEKIGMQLEDVLRRGYERMPTADFKFFSIVLQIQRQTGGNLAETLENLTGVLRARKKMKDKVSAMSSEAKSSAAIIGALPFIVAIAVSLVNPLYLVPLFTTTAGNVMIGIGVGWMALGVLVMAKMINFEM